MHHNCRCEFLSRKKNKTRFKKQSHQDGRVKISVWAITMATISVCISPYSPVALQTWCINSEHFGNFTADITNNTPVAINKAYIVTTCDRLKLIITNNIKVEINMPCASCILRKRSIPSCRMWLNWNCLQAAKQIPILLKQGQYAMWGFFLHQRANVHI